jgi:hypothetical protein
MDQLSLMICVFCFGQFSHYSEKKLGAFGGKKKANSNKITKSLKILAKF